MESQEVFLFCNIKSTHSPMPNLTDYFFRCKSRRSCGQAGSCEDNNVSGRPCVLQGGRVWAGPARAAECQPQGHPLPAVPAPRLRGAASGVAIFTVSLPCPEEDFSSSVIRGNLRGAKKRVRSVSGRVRDRKEHRDGRALTKLGIFMLVYNYAILSWHRGAGVVVVMV